MQYLQPTRKSFGNYIKIGYEFASHKKVNKDLKRLFDMITVIDDSVLIMDDILDKSELRNGTPCFYKIHGTQKAIITAKFQECEAINALMQLAVVLKTKEQYVHKILKTFNEFLMQVYTGQKIDYELSKINNYAPEILKKYFEMIRIFTGGHIKYSIRIGHLLANEDVNPEIDKIADSIGIIRQICDDYNDYFEQHHEPCGDFKIGCNRLPEILFKKQNGNRKKVVSLISKREFSKVREIVLTSETRKIMHECCKKEYKKVEKLIHTYHIPIIVEHFEGIIS